MAFCANCGSSVEGRFCAKCGSAVVSSGPAAGAVPPGSMPPPPPGSYPPGSMPPPPPATAGAPMADNLSSALCYSLGLITGIIFLVISPYNQNRTVRFHAFQSIFLSVAAIAIRIVLLFVLGIMNLWGFFMLSWLVSLAFFVIWLFLIISAYQGKTIVLPVIGSLAQQQAGT